MRTLLSFLLTATLILFAACAHTGKASNTPTSTPTSAPIGTADARLDRLVDDYYEDYLRLNPLAATYIGDTRYNDRLAIDISPAYRKSLVELHRKHLASARRIDTASLAPAAQLTLAIFTYECEMALALAAYPRHLLPIDQWSNLALTMPELGSGESAQPFATVRDYDNFLKRIEDFDRWVDRAIVNLREGTQQGFIQPHALMVKVLPQLQSQIVDTPGQSIFYRPIEHLPNSFSEHERKRLKHAYERAIMRHVVPAYRRLHDFVRDRYLPATRASVAWTVLPHGADWYRQLIKLYTTTSMQAEEIHALGLQEVARIRAEMQGIQSRVGIDGGLPQFFRQLESNPELYFRQADDLLNAHRDLKARIDAKLPALFSVFPKADYQIRPVEEFRQQSAAGAMYQQPSADGKRPGIFYVNTYNLKAQPKFAMTSLSLHEAAPGHHFQISTQQEIAGLPRFRRFLVGYTAYVEGWALYAESLGYEMNLYDDPYQRFGHLNEAMLRAMRLVVDTGLHTRGWSREQAIAYMLENSSMAPSDAEAEVERYIADPGQALGYKLGQLRIRALRDRAQQALGANFDVKQFHYEVLRDGPLPLDLLAAKIERWIDTRR